MSDRALILATLGGLTWGVLAFGAVYAWAYWPLAIAVGAIGVAGLIRARGRHALRDADAWTHTVHGATRALHQGPLTVALAALWLAILVQLIPLPAPARAWLSPSTDHFLRQYDLAFAARVAGIDSSTDSRPGPLDVSVMHPVSINPRATRVGLGLLTAFTVFLLGLSAVLSRTGARPLALGIVGIGLLVAVMGIVQMPLYAGKIYGVWRPQQGGWPFGPFVNRHHFAGWMTMAISLGIGYCAAGLTQAMRGTERDWRARLLWFSSPDANKLLGAGLAVIVMALSLVLTLSRSGIAALTLALLLAIGTLSRRLGSVRRTLAAGFVALVFLLAVGGTGVNAVAYRFATASWADVGGRLGAWKDAVTMIRRFPLTGSGLNTYGTAMLAYQTFQVDMNLFREAHNDYLQLAAEGGLLVGLPAVAALAMFGGTVRRRFREPSDDATYWLRAFAVIGLVAIGLQETIDFSLQMPGNAALFCTLAAVAIHRAPRATVGERRTAGAMGTTGRQTVAHSRRRV